MKTMVKKLVIEIPENATNRDVLKGLFPTNDIFTFNEESTLGELVEYISKCKKWLDATYQNCAN